MFVEPVIIKKKELYVPKTRFEYRMFKISDLNYSPLNPTMRTTPKKIKPLAKNIAKNGQNNPITVIEMRTKGGRVFRVVDGHRRCHALESLGKKEVHGLILKNKKINFDKTFTSLHEHTLKITTAQECERWLKGASNISTRTLNGIKELESFLGKAVAKSMIRRCVTLETSPHSTLDGIRWYRRYTGKITREDNKMVAYWLLNISTTWKMKMAIEAFIPTEILIDSIENKKIIPVDWALRR